MSLESDAAGEAVFYESGQILSGPDDAIWDDIFDWIQNAIHQIIDNITEYIRIAIDWIVDRVKWVIEAIASPIKTALEWVKSHLGAVWDWVVDTYRLVSDWVINAYNTVRSAVSSTINVVGDWIADAASNIRSWIRSEVSQVASWITTGISSLISTIGAWFGEQRIRISSWLTSLRTNIGSWLSSLWSNISAGFTAVTASLVSGLEGVGGFIQDKLIDPMNSWWETFTDKLFDFATWVDKLLDAVFNWLHKDIPGGTPLLIIIGAVIASVALSFASSYGIQRLRGTDKSFIDYGVEQLGYLMSPFTSVVTQVMEAIERFVSNLGIMSPDTVKDNYSSLATVGMTAIGGLGAMTIAGEFLNPISHLGFGHVSAMIYDMTNYKLITGAAMGALTFAMIRVPLNYYYNRLFRPQLLSERDFMELMSRRAFTEPGNLQNPALSSSVQALTGGDGEVYEELLISYFGHRDEYVGLYKELANTPLRYFPLAGIARTGFFDKTWFTEALARSGYSKTAKDALMVMYEKMRDEALQGAMSGAAVTRFKEGFTDEVQFHAEMTILGYSDEQFVKYLAAAEMDYATDYIRDLLTAYRDALRKGHIDMDQYRDTLLGLGIVPERVEAYVLKEKARLKPEEELTPISVPKPVFETDAGKVKVDTLRRRRRKILISRDEEIAGLIDLGMEPNYAEAIANNDDVRLAEKGGEE